MRELVCRCCGRPDVAGWLRDKGYNISPQLDAQLGRALVWRGPRAKARNLAQPESVFRRRLAKKGLPTPACWAGLANALAAVRRLRERPCADGLSIALSLGYSDFSGLAHLLRRNFGLTLTQVRDESCYPLEILVELWWARSQRAARDRQAA